MVNLTIDELPPSHFEPKHKKDKQRDEKIKHFTELLMNKVITVEEFLNEMASDDNRKYSFSLN